MGPAGKYEGLRGLRGQRPARGLLQSLTKVSPGDLAKGYRPGSPQAMREEVNAGSQREGRGLGEGERGQVW